MPHPNPPPPPQPMHSLPKAEGASRTGLSWDFASAPPPPEGHRKLPAKAGTEFQVPGFYCAVSIVPVSHRDAPTYLGDLKFTLNLNPVIASLKGPPAFSCIFTDTQQSGAEGGIKVAESSFATSTLGSFSSPPLSWSLPNILGIPTSLPEQ